jgi:hypothetical protein
MARKRFTTERIIGLLREAEVRLSQGQAIDTVCRGIGAEAILPPAPGLTYAPPRPAQTLAIDGRVLT